MDDEGGFTGGFLGRAIDNFLKSSRTASEAKAAATGLSEKITELTGERKTSPEQQRAEILSSTTFIPRSALFVPCSHERAMHKIPKIPADTFILDLEDAVPPRQKLEARERMVEILKSGALDGRRLVVRINSVRATPQWGFADLDACGIVAEKLYAIAVPKVSPLDFELMRPHLHPEQRLWAFFETPRSILQAEEICESNHYEIGVMGTNDLAAELQLPMLPPAKPKTESEQATTSTDSASSVSKRFGLLASLSHVVNCCRAHNMGVLDGVFNDPTDRGGLGQECSEGKLLGFDGKTLIHPDQLATCHSVYDPSAFEVEWAETIVKAMSDAPPESQGGVIVVEGRIVEELHVRRARSILVRAGQSRLLRELAEKLAQDQRDAHGDGTEEHGGEKQLGTKGHRLLKRQAQNWNHVNQPGCFYEDGSDKFKL